MIATTTTRPVSATSTMSGAAASNTAATSRTSAAWTSSDEPGSRSHAARTRATARLVAMPRFQQLLRPREVRRRVDIQKRGEGRIDLRDVVGVEPPDSNVGEEPGHFERPCLEPSADRFGTPASVERQERLWLLQSWHHYVNIVGDLGRQPPDEIAANERHVTRKCQRPVRGRGDENGTQTAERSV